MNESAALELLDRARERADRGGFVQMYELRLATGAVHLTSGNKGAAKRELDQLIRDATAKGIARSPAERSKRCATSVRF